MKTLWEYDLPTSERPNDYDYESPILIRNGFVYYISRSVNDQKLLHLIDMKNGTGRTQLLQAENLCLPNEYFFIEYKEQVILYADDLFIYHKGELDKAVELTRKGSVKTHLLLENRLIMSCSKKQDVLLCCYDLDTRCVEWEMDITNSSNYIAGELAICENLITCYGRDQLLFLECDTGNIAYSIKLSRIDKLFCPIKIDNENMLIGYTNWTNAGILKYNFRKKEIVWRHKRKFQGPQLKCKIYQQNDLVFWVKNSTELIALNIETGDERYHLQTAPWLYTDLQFLQNDFIYGTSGADGYINSVETKSGERKWSVFLKNGCVYYDLCGDSVIVGDYDKTLKQISFMNGVILQNYPTDGEVVGRIRVFDDCIYTVLWGNEKKGVRFVKVLI